jgi:hypothetical protein
VQVNVEDWTLDRADETSVAVGTAVDATDLDFQYEDTGLLTLSRNFLRTTQTEPGATGNVRDLSETQGTPTTLGSGSTSSGSSTKMLEWVRTVGATVGSATISTQLQIAAVSAATLAYKWQVHRYNSAGVLQASSDFSAEHNTTGIKVATLTLDTVWQPDDWLGYSLWLRKAGGGGSRSVTVAVNDADSWAEFEVATVEDATATPATVAVTASVPAPAAQAGAAATPATVAVVSTAGAVVVQTGAAATPATVAAAAAIPAVTVQAGAAASPATVVATVTISGTAQGGGGGAISVREVVTDVAISTTASVTTGAGTQTTDLLVAVGMSEFYNLASEAFGPPTGGGWTEQATAELPGDNTKIRLWTKTAPGGATQVDLDPMIDEGIALAVLVLDGADLGAPVEDADGAASSAATPSVHVAPSIDPTSADAFLLCAAASAVFGGVAAYTPPGGMAEQFEVGTSGGGAATFTAAVEQLAAAGVTGTRSFTFANNGVAGVALAAAVKTGAGGPDATATPATVAAVAAVAQPAVQAGAAPAPATVAAVAAVPAVTVQAGAQPTPAVVAASAAVPAPEVSTGATPTPAAAVAVATVPAPTVTTTGDVTATPATVAGAATVPEPAPVAGATPTPATTPATADVPSPVVQAGAAPSTATVATTGSVGTAQVSAGGAAGPTTTAAVAGIPAPTVSTTGDAAAAPTAVACTVDIGAAAQASATATPTTASATATIPAPTVAAGSVVFPATLSCTATVPAPGVTAGGSAAASAATVTAIVAVPAVAVTTDATITVQTVAGAATVGVVTVQAGAGPSPATVTGLTAMPAPDLATTATAVPATVAVIVVIGSVAIGSEVAIRTGSIGARSTTAAATVRSTTGEVRVR